MNYLGIHHVSAIVGHPQEAIDFYSGVLGLKLVKKTLNFDDKEQFHLYFGSNQGTPGTLMTLFPWTNNVEGTKGGGQVSDTMFMIPKNSIEYWQERLTSFKIGYQLDEQFGKIVLKFKDRHNLDLILIETDDENLHGDYTFNGVLKEKSIIGIYGVKISSTDYLKTLDFFVNEIGYKIVDENHFYFNLEISAKFGSNIILIKNNIPRGTYGIGTVHHVAFAVQSYDDLNLSMSKLKENYFIVDIKNRKYFYSIYLRENGGNIIEIATSDIGMLIDEDVDLLGTTLKIPPHYEENKDELLKNIMPLFVKEVQTLDDYPYIDKQGYEMYSKTKTRLARINELAKKESLTEVEKEEQRRLREEHIKMFRSGFKETLESIEIEEEVN